MNIVKRSHGSKPVAMLRYFLIFSFFGLIFSCSKQESEPNIYDIQIKNAYFETIDSVKIGSHYLGRIEQGNISESIFVTKEIYEFSCITTSELLITSQINIQGLEEHITIKLNERGNVELE